MECRYRITRKIEIDAGHRVPHHGSKCKNLHGHRYVIEATCVGPLIEEGEQQGMVLDFGFLKEEMVEHIDEPCDHGTILWIEDQFARSWLRADQLDAAREDVGAYGYSSWPNGRLGKLYLIDSVPTAENLAAHWYTRLLGAVHKRSEGKATLVNVRVWETPNCYADFPGV